MNIGSLNMRIKIYRYTKSINDKTHTTERKPTLLCEAWANISPRTGSMLTGREAFTMLTKTTHLITVRSGSCLGIADDCYILWTDEFGKEHRFEIDYILPPAGTRFMNIYTEEVIRNDYA